ncbi:MAG: two-component system response regulator [Chloroflexi bacterium 13_1_40CM_4_68_4]|nr:MAG: two-component system response regulator [Chloroflexi bacterium 13_1_40CM_4_68_4]
MNDGALVLIVEDNEKNMKLARDVLQFKGFRTLSAASAEDGIALASAEHPDLILMDIQLPGMDGIAALRRLRTNPDTAKIPVIAFTASVMKEDRDRFDAAGFDGRILKPIDVKDFPEQVRRFAEQGRRS